MSINYVDDKVSDAFLCHPRETLFVSNAHLGQVSLNALSVAWGERGRLQIFDRIDSLIDADDCRAVIEEARALLLQLEQRSDALTHAIDDFLLDLMTLAFIVECYGRGFELLARTLARRRLAKVRLSSGGADSARGKSHPKAAG
ncbi:hypothetical protein DBIPINDM_007540 (plasmid) [Mesorhizobium sp. AR02]|uniref:hypothetical protein n=1 Tax=Mesorhizobium sp. AR02 TaxID=2865837 RepID=UPI00215F36AC|nr:hypothetical protein [Mesorhizobium sp. AR02]UVK50228.1 hypothetical protein DBIPINDM_007540 [Mesorhizobium sp. AR02]